MEELDLVPVYTVKNPAMAEIIKNALAEEGIDCTLDNESQAGLTGIFDIRVMVRADDADRARELIESHVPEETDEMGDFDDEDDEDL
jgi:hypothetical protein